MDVVVTEFGVVKISAKSLAWLNSLDEDWREIRTNKRRRGKRAKWVRAQIQRFEAAVMVAADVAWHAGEDLQEF